MRNIRTDLMLEAQEMYFENSKLEHEIAGVKTEQEAMDGGIFVTRVQIVSDKGEKLLGKKMGNYVTLEIPPKFRDAQTTYEQMCEATAKELKNIIDLKPGYGTVLVVGLGNWNITADALGPKVVDSLLITRHLIEYVPEEIDEGVRPVCGIAPGVLGLTGIETGEVVKGLVDRIKPDLVIAIDALCSRRMDRINNTIQIADTGIVPGAGIGNNRMGLNVETLGVPVIAIGVPTVVDAATIAGDTIDLMINNLKSNARENEPLYRMLCSIEDEEKYGYIKEVIHPAMGDFIVTPKEVDSTIEDISSVIANGINISLHEGITLEDIDRYR